MQIGMIGITVYVSVPEQPGDKWGHMGEGFRMNVFKRAVLYLVRKKVRSILLFLLLFFMGLFMLTGLSIHRSAGWAAKEMQKSISSGLEIKMFEVPGDEIYTISHNENGELVRSLKKSLITESVAEELASISGVSGYYSEMGAEVLYTGLNVAPGGFTEELRRLEAAEEAADLKTIACDRVWSRANDFLVVQESEYYPYFRNGAFELVSGRHLHMDDTGKILISDKLAAGNGLDIGDVIDGQRFDFITGELYGEIYHAEIVGIFRINFEQQYSEWIAEPEILENIVFGPFEMRHWGQRQYNIYYGGDVLAKEEDRLLGSVTFFVEDPAELDKIEAQMKENEHVDWSYYAIQRYDADYKAAAKPLLSMTLFAACMVAVSIGGTLLILFLALAMWMRSRQHEIDVLTFLGINGRMILVQFLIEAGIVVVTAFFMSRISALPVTHAVGNAMTEFTNPPEEAAPFSTTYEATTGITYINRTPVKQDTLSYEISCSASAGTLLAMVLVSFGTIAFVFRGMQNTARLSQKGSDIHHWNFQMTGNKGVLKAHHRAFLYVTRKTGKSILLLFTIFVIMGLFLSGLSIRAASEHAAAQLRESLGGYFKMIPEDRKNEVVNQIDQELMNHIMELDDMEAANAMDICYMDALGFSLNPGKFTAENDEKASMTRISGNTDTRLNEYFYLEILELVDGEHIKGSDEGKAVISSELAQRNHLQVGDHVTISTSGEDIRNGALRRTCDLEITGLFSERQPASGAASHMPECDIPSNFIFTDISTTQQMMQDMRPGRKQVYSGGAAFFVKDPEKLEEVILKIEEAGFIDQDLTKLMVNNAAYQKSMEPLNRLSSLSLIMLVIIAGTGAILLTLTLTLWERDRIHETGILMSFGIRKQDIWWQRLIECASVFIIAFLISVITFLPVADKMGDWLYEQASAGTERSAESENDEYVMTWEAINTDSMEEDRMFQVELSPGIIIRSGLGGLVLVGGSVSMAFFLNAHHKPKELLATME